MSYRWRKTAMHSGVQMLIGGSIVLTVYPKIGGGWCFQCPDLNVRGAHKSFRGAKEAALFMTIGAMKNEIKLLREAI